MLMTCCLSICTLALLDLVSEPVEALLHLSYLIAEMCNQSFAGFGLVSSCGSISSVIADHLVEPVKRCQGSSRAESQALRSPCLHLVFGKWGIDKLVWRAVHDFFKRGEAWIVGH